MNRVQKVEFLGGLVKGTNSLKELSQLPQFEYDYEAMTDEQLEKVVEMSPKGDEESEDHEISLTPEQRAFLDSLPLKMVPKKGDRTDWNLVTVEQVHKVMQGHFGNQIPIERAELVLKSLRDGQKK